MKTRMTLAGAGARVAYYSIIVLALVLAACAAPTAPESPTAAPPPTAAPAPTQTQAAPTASAGASEPATVTLTRNDPLGAFLADGQGRALYLFTKDAPNTSNCYDQCEQAWPPLLTQGAAKAGDGVDAALLGTTTRKDGSTQVTYSGWPLYYFVKDQKPGDVTGQNVGGVWFVVSAKGDKIEAAPAAASGSESPIATPAAASGSPVATSGAAGSSGQTVKINVQNFAFDPKSPTVKAGTTVIWHNSDTVAHTVTSDTGLFDSPLPPGADFQFTFDKAGSYPYYCRPHGGPGEQGMSGVITVE